MKIYLDILIVSNVLITLIFIRILSLTVHTKIRRKRLLLCMLPASAASLLIMIKPDSFAESLLITIIKITASALIVKTAFGLKAGKRLLIYTSAYIAENIAFGGICMVIWELFGAKFLMTGNFTVYFNVPFPLLIICIAAAYAAITLYERVMFTTHTRAESYRATFNYGDISVDIPAVSDSGNRLTDSFSGEPVVVFSSDRLYRLFDLDREELYPAAGFHLIPYSTVNSTSLLPVTLKGKVTISDSSGSSRELRCAVGILKSSGRERAIFDPRLLI